MGRPFDPFDAMKAGETRKFNSFTADQVGDPLKGGMQIVRGSGSPFGMMDMYRVSGYTPEQATAAVTAGYNAKLTDVNTGLRPAESASDIALQGAQGVQARATGNLMNVNAALRPAESAADIALQRSQGFAAEGQGIASRSQSQIALDEATAGVSPTELRAAGLVDPKTPLPAGKSRARRTLAPLPDYRSGFDLNRIGRAKGETKVPGKGSGKVDSVPRMLAPGEAVINKAAAEHMGRGLIAALNHMGAKKMGLV